MDVPPSPPLPNTTTIKTFIPLENNPLVLTHLARHLGVPSTLSFHDIYSISSPADTSHIPRPVYALIFLCPAAVYYRARGEENEAMEAYEGFGPTEPILYFHQTIRHACGLIALLHALTNGPAKTYIPPSSPLSRLLEAAIPLRRDARAQLLYESKEIETAHAEAARLGDTVAPAGEEENGFHFITFVRGEKDGHLWELNGGMKGPVDRGALKDDEDALSERALDSGVRTFLKHAGEEDLGFSIVALTPRADDA